MPAVVLLLLAQLTATPPGVVIDHHPASSRQYIGSPSLAILPNGDYVASHDFFGPGSTVTTSAVTRVFRSTDRGRSWSRAAELNDLTWANFFVHRGRLYLLGTHCEYGRIVIRRSADGGATWSEPAFLTVEGNYHTAPVPMVEWKGRLWRAMEYHPPGPWGFFEALTLSAPAKADLLDPRSWTLTERLPYPAAQAGEGSHWLEGNLILDRRRGGLLNILRVHNIEKAALARYENGRLRFEEMVAFPGGAKKFTIRYDRKSRKYWTLANPAPEAKDPASVRNTLTLVSSTDLRHWSEVRTVLSHPDPLRHGFQYADWQFDGDDIAAVSRTAFDDGEGGAPRAHDANYLTFHRVPNFRSPR